MKFFPFSRDRREWLKREYWAYWAIVWFGIVVYIMWALLFLFGWSPP
jgi:cytosine/uracil/thiamine/allantoin permease